MTKATTMAARHERDAILARAGARGARLSAYAYLLARPGRTCRQAERKPPVDLSRMIPAEYVSARR